MTSYKIDLESGLTEQSNKYRFASEGGHLISPQQIITANPQMVIDIPEVDIQCDDMPLVACEYGTSRGPIDILIITSNADVIIVETKLLRNSESHRTVVAQSIDYTKALYSENIKDVLSKLEKNATINQKTLVELRRNEVWRATLDKNISSGNFQVVILGDEIHPNVIGMVESIQSAPHMAFTIYLVELDPVAFDKNTVIVTPRVVSKTLEVERSVIRIQIDHEKKTHQIESEIPSKEGKGSKPKLTEAEYLDSVTRREFRDAIENFWDNWKAVGGDIRMGTVGFSAGINYSGKRIPIFYAYHSTVDIIPESHKLSYNIPDELYNQYRSDLKSSETVYDGYCISNKRAVHFDRISQEDLQIIIDSSINLAKRLIESEES